MTVDVVQRFKEDIKAPADRFLSRSPYFAKHRIPPQREKSLSKRNMVKSLRNGCVMKGAL